MMKRVALVSSVVAALCVVMRNQHDWAALVADVEMHVEEVHGQLQLMFTDLCKPDPEVFLKGAAKLNRKPERCVVFEDAFVGIQAGKSGGMKVVGIASTHPIEKLTEADLALHNLEGVSPMELLARLGLSK